MDSKFGYKRFGPLIPPEGFESSDKIDKNTGVYRKAFKADDYLQKYVGAQAPTTSDKINTIMVYTFDHDKAKSQGALVQQRWAEIQDVMEIEFHRLTTGDNLPISGYCKFVEDCDPLTEHLKKQATDDEESDTEDMKSIRQIGKQKRL